MTTLALATVWTPATATEPLSYAILLTNTGGTPISNFKLGVSGPARIDPHAEVEGGTLEKRLSNHSMFAPPSGYVLAPGDTWEITCRGLSYPLRHWSDGVRGAYVVRADGALVEVVVLPTATYGADLRPRSGAVRFPVPDACSRLAIPADPPPNWSQPWTLPRC
jgi:hexosaminidase